ncbi:MAG TPA: hypothetical protein VMG12_14150 [Polyangiaceae bacterium]|nr:hypothetical protein [Polyangiaceae bacterium]
MKTLVSKAARGVLPALAVSMFCSACSTTGTAVGRLEQPTGPGNAVTLVWKSDAANPDRGTISGTLPDGSHYAGRYFEVLKTADADIYGPAWVGWRPYWSGWRMGWYSGPVRDLDWPGFVTIYTGRVIANMKSDDDQGRLRCRFRLDDPRAGLVHGGHGECQLSNGQTIDHVIVASN